MELLMIAIIVFPLSYAVGTLIYGRPKTDQEIDAMIAKMHEEEDARRDGGPFHDVQTMHGDDIGCTRGE